MWGNASKTFTLTYVKVVVEKQEEQFDANDDMVKACKYLSPV